MVEKTWPIVEKLILNILSLSSQLYEQLVQEGDLLKSAPQAEFIDGFTTQKKQLIKQLEEVNLQFGQVLDAERLPNNQDGIAAYFQRAEEAGLLIAETLNNWQQIKLICTECRTLNEQNGASIELLTIHAKRSLDILKGKERGSSTYGRDGVAKSDSLTHTLTFYL